MTRENSEKIGGLSMGDKPFPWRCPYCKQVEVRPAEMPYEAVVKHEKKTYHLRLSALRVPQCQNCKQTLFDTTADEQIIQALRDELRILSPNQIRSYLRQLGLTQKKFANLIRTPPETVSRWLNGVRIQSKSSDDHIRRFFHDQGVFEQGSELGGYPDRLNALAASSVGETIHRSELELVREWEVSFPNVRDMTAVVFLSMRVSKMGCLLPLGT